MTLVTQRMISATERRRRLLLTFRALHKAGGLEEAVV